MNVLALHVGTETVKAVVVNAATGEMRSAIVLTSYATAAPTPDAVEVRAEVLWDAVAGAARQAVQQSGLSGRVGHDIAGIGLTTFAPGLILLDKEDRPVAPIWLPSDRRARPAARQVWAHVGEEFLAATGSRPLPGVASALGWRQQLAIDPYVSHRIGSYLHVNGWLAFQMTGVKAFDFGNASQTGLFGTLIDQDWSARWCDYFEVDRAWLPPILCGSATVGTLRAGVASELGVPAGIPVKLGSDELGSTILSAGLEPDEMLSIVGATQMLAALTNQPRSAPRRLTRRLGVGPRFVHVAHNPIGAEAFEWLRGLCFREQSKSVFYEETIPLLCGRRTRVNFDPPFLAGDLFEIESHRAAFRDLELSTDRLDLVAAMLEELERRHCEAVKDLGVGVSFQRVVMSGVGVEVMRGLLADYRASPVRMLEDGALRGVARLFAEA